MTTRIKILVETVIEYGPQRVTVGQIMNVQDDAVAQALINQGVAVLDNTDLPTIPPMTDAGNDEFDIANG